MFGTPRSLLVFVSLFLSFSTTLQAQSQDSRSAFNFETGSRSTYFVDEAGIQLMQDIAPLDEIIDPTTYILGAYDVISIQGSGLNEFVYRTVAINASGDIILPVVGKISLQGRTISDASEYLNSYFANYFKETEVSLSLDAPRPVNIHIGGDIPNPGRFTIPAGTRFDALVNGFRVNDKILTTLTDFNTASGTNIRTSRPSVSGIDFEKLNARNQDLDEKSNSLFNTLSQTYDFRLVKVTHKNGEVDYIDLSAYFNSGDIAFNPYIKDGDQITMIERSASRTTISISGAVNEPFTGSFRSDDSIERLLAIAGGYLPEADSTEIIRIRANGITSEKERLSLSDIKEVKAGDQFIVPFNKSEQALGTVDLIGEISIQGSYPIIDGKTTLADALLMAEGFTDEALPNGAYLIRSSLEDLRMKQSSQSNLTMLMKSSDQYVEGFDYLELEESLSPNQMPLNLSDPEVAKSVVLRNGDRVYIPKDNQTISMLGQVNKPGFYVFDSGKNVADYLVQAGGTTVAADRDRVFVIKAGSKTWYRPTDTNLQSGDIIFVDRVPFEDVSTGRNYSLQLQQLKNNRTQLWIAGVGTIASIVTAYAAVRRLN